MDNSFNPVESQMQGRWILVVALLIGGANVAGADMRGEIVCGLPPTEPVLLRFSAPWEFADGTTELVNWACGPYGCDRYQGSPDVTEEEYVCDVSIAPWTTGETFVAEMFRLGPLGYPPLDPDESIDLEYGPSDARYYVRGVMDSGALGDADDGNDIPEIIRTLIDAVGSCPVCETTLNPEPGQWGVLAGRLVDGESKEILFSVVEGATYLVAGTGGTDARDLDICVYDQDGGEVGCDTLPDSFPVVEFTAGTTGTFRAILTAFDMEGDGGANAAMAIVRLGSR